MSFSKAVEGKLQVSSPEKVKTTQEGGKALKSAFHSNWGKAKQVLIQQPFSCVTSGHLLEQATVLFSPNS